MKKRSTPKMTTCNAWPLYYKCSAKKKVGSTDRCAKSSKITLRSIRKYSRPYTLAEVMQARGFLAEMTGRAVTRAASEATTVTYSVVKLDRQGYDSNGRNFGVGAKLFTFTVDPDEVMTSGSRGLYFRSYDRVKARQILSKAFPSAKIVYEKSS